MNTTQFNFGVLKKSTGKKIKRVLLPGFVAPVLALFVFFQPVFGQSSNDLMQSVFNGTWKVDPGSYKSTMQVTFTLMNGIYRVQSTGQPDILIKADGHFHKVTGQPGFDAESVRIIDDHTVETTREKNGKKFRNATFSVNPDGKTGTFSFSSVNNGHTFKGKSILTRVAAGPTGSHAISGTWQMKRGVGSSSWTMTYKIHGNDIDFHSSTGDSYHARLDGTETKVTGDKPGEKTSVVMLSSHKLREIYRVKDKIGNVSVTTVSADGKTARVVDHDLDNGNTTTLTMTKQ
ncbi:MAG: hypothetical protein PVH63_07885 [Balneolaceae bacterium]|jgi:hypothetical protein